MFSKTAKYYDLLYSFKDYAAETQVLLSELRSYQRSSGKRLLDVACGSGCHIEHLRQYFSCEGLDIDQELIALARKRNPGLIFHIGDMVDFYLDTTYDVITCLFSSIGYVKTLENLTSAICCMAQHLVSGGILAVEPWFTPDTWKPNTLHLTTVDLPDLKIARINNSKVEGRLSYFDFHYLIGTPENVEHHVEHHELGLFTVEETNHAFTSAGLEIFYNDQGLTGRGLYIGRLP